MPTGAAPSRKSRLLRARECDALLVGDGSLVAEVLCQRRCRGATNQQRLGYIWKTGIKHVLICYRQCRKHIVPSFFSQIDFTRHHFWDDLAYLYLMNYIVSSIDWHSNHWFSTLWRQASADWIASRICFHAYNVKHFTYLYPLNAAPVSLENHFVETIDLVLYQNWFHLSSYIRVDYEVTQSFHFHFFYHLIYSNWLISSLSSSWNKDKRWSCILREIEG